MTVIPLVEFGDGGGKATMYEQVNKNAGTDTIRGVSSY